MLEETNKGSSLEGARAAVRQGDWSAAIVCLQKLSLDEEFAEVRQEFLDLALEVLAAGDFKARWDVAKLLPRAGKLGLAPAIAIACDPEADLEERWFVGRLLGQFDTPEAIDALVNMLREGSDPDLAAIAANALATIGPPAIAPLAALLEHPETCALAALALSQIPHPATVEPLLRAARAEDAAVRATAIAAVANFQDERVLPVLVGALQDLAAPARKAAASGLAPWLAAGSESPQLADYRLIERLQPLLYDLNLGVCQQAALTIGRSRSDAAAGILATELQAPLTPNPLKLTLARALAWMESAAALAGLARALPVVPEPVALEIVRVLGRIERSSLKAAVSELLVVYYATQKQTASLGILQALAHAWGLQGHPRAREPLEQLARHPDSGVCLHARAALECLETTM